MKLPRCPENYTYPPASTSVQPRRNEGACAQVALILPLIKEKPE